MVGAFLFLLLQVNIGFIYGVSFQITPFQMEVQAIGSPFPGLLPNSFPSPLSPLSMMDIPPILNPFEIMGKEGDPLGRSLSPESGGMAENVTTKNKTESKDGFKITTITNDGPGFHSYIKEYEKENTTSSNKNGTAAGPSFDIAKMLQSGRLFDLINNMKQANKKPKKCKKCGSDKFCDPIFHLCRKKFAEGRTCMAEMQCGKKLRCQWGKCQKVEKGDPGTFCKTTEDCNGDSCCRNTPGSFHMMCIPQQNEGAICGLHQRAESLAKIFYVVKRSADEEKQCLPCKKGLKCANTGGSKFKHCTADDYVEKASDALENDNPSNAITDGDNNDDDDDDDDEASATNPLQGIPPAGKLPNEAKNPIDAGSIDKDGNSGDDENDDGDNDDSGNDENDEEEEKDDKEKEEKTVSNGNGGVDIKVVPKKNKGKSGKKGAAASSKKKGKGKQQQA